MTVKQAAVGMASLVLFCVGLFFLFRPQDLDN